MSTAPQIGSWIADMSLDANKVFDVAVQLLGSFDCPNALGCSWSNSCVGTGTDKVFSSEAVVFGLLFLHTKTMASRNKERLAAESAIPT